MYKYRVSVDDVKSAASAKSDIGFSNMDIRLFLLVYKCLFLLTSKIQ